MSVQNARQYNAMKMKNDCKKVLDFNENAALTYFFFRFFSFFHAGVVGVITANYYYSLFIGE